MKEITAGILRDRFSEPGNNPNGFPGLSLARPAPGAASMSGWKAAYSTCAAFPTRRYADEFLALELYVAWRGTGTSGGDAGGAELTTRREFLEIGGRCGGDSPRAAGHAPLLNSG